MGKLSFFGLLLVWSLAPLLQAGLDKANAEQNLEKRSKLALDNAAQALAGARLAYAKGESANVPELLQEVQHSVELAYTSLKNTGKDPRKSPKYFKKAEIMTRELMRNLNNFRDEMSVADRPLLDKLRDQVQDVHENLLLGIMEGKRK